MRFNATEAVTRKPVSEKPEEIASQPSPSGWADLDWNAPMGKLTIFAMGTRVHNFFATIYYIFLSVDSLMSFLPLH